MNDGSFVNASSSSSPILKRRNKEKEVPKENNIPSSFVETIASDTIDKVFVEDTLKEDVDFGRKLPVTQTDQLSFDFLIVEEEKPSKCIQMFYII